MNNDDIKKDILFQNFLANKPNLSEDSKRNYLLSLTKFCKATNSTLNEIITNCKTQQNKVIEKIISKTQKNNEEIIEKSIIQFNVNNPDSYIQQYLNTFINFCKNKKNSNVTINTNLTLIFSFLNYYSVELPKMERLEQDSKKWYLLTKEDFKFVISDSTLLHASLIKFLMSSGMRIKDALSLTIGDFMEATSEYHNFVDVEDFIDNAPEDMIGSWYFNPHKTKRYSVECQTFNDPESSNLILQNLRKIKNEFIPRKNRENKLNLKVSKSDALFGSRNSDFKGHLIPKNVADVFWRKNKKLKNHRINLIKESIKKGEISKEDYEKEVDKIPRFHAHACRKFFGSMIAKNCGSLRICTLMEGHISPVATDESYIQHGAAEVKESYMLALDDFSLEKTETKVYTSKVRQEMEDKINALQSQNDDLQGKLNELGNIEEKIEAKIREAMGKQDVGNSDDLFS